MARIVKMNGRTYVEPRWQDSPTDVYTIIGDNRRERADTNKQKLATMYLFDRR